ncbi:DUF4307 domain-containing protein [Streptacidiphilus anmyonensis]|uniref:DUF4307 domain-containing protein n=1 Tax=Streptacidiphilus anmyonensis TaxID=405782 RepID=UPI0005AB3FB7|nr:DUF4307 domain-containing protein [Streptacidiphilus anmyonensis]
MADTTPDVRPAESAAEQLAAQPPVGRYGRRDEKKARVRGKRVYYVTVALALALVAAIGYEYVSGNPVNGEVQTFQVISAHEVRITLEVSKPSDKAASCTVRSRDANGDEVGRVSVAIPKGTGDTQTTVLLRTTSLGTTGELVGCS